MARYDGLIIPRSYNDYINKSSVIDVQEALQLTGVMDDTPTAGSNKPVKSGGVYSAINNVTTPELSLGRAGTYTINYIKKVALGKISFYFGSVTIGSDATGYGIYLKLDGIQPSSTKKIYGDWYVENGESGIIQGTSVNDTLWIYKGVTTDQYMAAEGAGKTIIFKAMVITW